MEQRLGDFVRADVGDAGVVDLSVPPQILERAQRLFDRHGVVPPVTEIEVDGVGGHAAEGRLASGLQMSPSVAAMDRQPPHGEIPLGGHDQLVPVLAFFHPPAQQGLGAAAGRHLDRNGIAVCGVEEADPPVVSRVEDREARLFVGLAGQRHGSEAELGDFEAGSPKAVPLHGTQI